MYESTPGALWDHRIDLTQEADFDLGSLRVRPATCEVESDGVSQTLQRRVMQVLVALTSARGAVVSQDDLVMRCWRGLAVTDDAIYRCISQLRKLAAGYPEAPFAIEAIPGVGYRLRSNGTRENENAVATSRRNHFRRTWIAAVALLVLTVAGAAYWITQNRAPDHPPSIRVAVQPFEALTASEGARLLALRIPNEIVDVLGDSQIETVLAGEQIKSATTSAPALIVTGILRDDGRNTVVDLRLEDGMTRAALWSMEFKRDSGEASDLPLEVAARVADIVNIIDFARNADPPLKDDSALTALLQTTDMLRGASDDAWAPMVQKAQDVVARHPEFAFGHDNLAAAYAEAADSLPERAREMRDAARREANLTLKLDPQDAGAYAVLSGLEAPDYRSQEEILLRGIKFAKHPRQPVGALHSYEAKLLSNVGRPHEALPHNLIAHATDEWGAAKTAQLARAYANVGNMPAARMWLQKGLQLWPNHSGMRRVQGYIVGMYESPAKARVVFDHLNVRTTAEENPEAIWRKFIEARSSRSATVTAAAIREIRAAADQTRITRENEIMMLAALGQPGQAIEVANSDIDHLRPESWVLFTPVTGNIRRDPGFVPLVSRLGLIKYWRETGKWPDFCTEPATRSECSPQMLAALKSN